LQSTEGKTQSDFHITPLVRQQRANMAIKNRSNRRAIPPAHH